MEERVGLEYRKRPVHRAGGDPGIMGTYHECMCTHTVFTSATGVVRAGCFGKYVHKETGGETPVRLQRGHGRLHSRALSFLSCATSCSL